MLFPGNGHPSGDVLSTMTEPRDHDHARSSEDLDLVRGALDRDADAIDRFLRRMRCVPRMLAAKNSRMGRPLSSTELEDVVQDTLIAIWRKLDRYNGSVRLETWVFRFAYLELLRSLRELRRDPGPLAPAAEPSQPAVEPDSLKYEHVHQALERVPEPEREVLELKHFDGLTFERIGACLGLSPNTVKTRYYRGLGRLRTHLAEPASAAGSGGGP